MAEPIRASTTSTDRMTTYRSGIIQATAHRLINRVVSDYLQTYDLTVMHWFIIGCIYDSGDAGIRLTDLTRSLQITLPYVTTAINFLESRGIVVKKAHDTDARIKLASIAPSYLLTVEEIETGLDETMRTQLYDHVRVSREELQSYINVLYKIAESDPRSA